ncbi:MAG: choice-of-anchor J domain-containing protein, partial [Ignavibacteriaceae bacterium]|nr:choice-of-anchor J domain-containing protein [Ignavibacteriaceae bacterium]
MRRVALLFLITISLSVFVQAQDKDFSQKPLSFDNPEYIFGPGLPGPSAVFSESFEGATFPPAGWVKASPDGGTGWARITAGTTPLPGWTGGTATPAPVLGAGTGIAYATWTTGGASSNDQWLISPQITNVQAYDSLTFWVRKFSNYADKMDIKISTTAQTVAAMTVLVASIVYATTDSGWVRFSYNIGGLVPAGSNIYIGWREFVADNFNDGDFLALDAINVSPLVPVELTSFTANVKENAVVLNWATATETNNSGFAIERKQDGQFVQVGFIKGSGTSTEVRNYSFNDANVETGNYTYRLKQIDLDGSFVYSNQVEVNIATPTVFSLNQNYPNPFNPSTKINFSLAVDSRVTLSVFNILGQKVATLLSSTMSAGLHNVAFDAVNFNNGVYIYKLEAA